MVVDSRLGGIGLFPRKEQRLTVIVLRSCTGDCTGGRTAAAVVFRPQCHQHRLVAADSDLHKMILDADYSQEPHLMRGEAVSEVDKDAGAMGFISMVAKDNMVSEVQLPNANTTTKLVMPVVCMLVKMMMRVETRPLHLVVIVLMKWIM